jgi:hypothetical protein
VRVLPCPPSPTGRFPRVTEHFSRLLPRFVQDRSERPAADFVSQQGSLGSKRPVYWAVRKPLLVTPASEVIEGSLDIRGTPRPEHPARHSIDRIAEVEVGIIRSRAVGNRVIAAAAAQRANYRGYFSKRSLNRPHWEVLFYDLVAGQNACKSVRHCSYLCEAGLFRTGVADPSYS